MPSAISLVVSPQRQSILKVPSINVGYTWNQNRSCLPLLVPVQPTLSLINHSIRRSVILQQKINMTIMLTASSTRCLKMGKLLPAPTPATGYIGYPIAGLGSSYTGLCQFACLAGYCPASACGKTKYTPVEPTISPFLPVYCVSSL